MIFFSQQAIESFAVTVKDIAQTLQGFGTELAEAELPDEVKAIEQLLETHTEKYRKLKVMLNPQFFLLTLPNLTFTTLLLILTASWKDAIRSVSKEGRHLLSNLETTRKDDDSQWDVKLDWETVQR